MPVLVRNVMDLGEGWSPPTDALVSPHLNQRLLSFTHRRNLCKKTRGSNSDGAAGGCSTARAVNKGAGVGQNKGGHLAEGTEACWVIEAGSAHFQHNTLLCLQGTKPLLCEVTGVGECGYVEQRVLISGYAGKRCVYKCSCTLPEPKMA